RAARCLARRGGALAPERRSGLRRAARWRRGGADPHVRGRRPRHPARGRLLSRDDGHEPPEERVCRAPRARRGGAPDLPRGAGPRPSRGAVPPPRPSTVLADLEPAAKPARAALWAARARSRRSDPAKVATVVAASVFSPRLAEKSP